MSTFKDVNMPFGNGNITLPDFVTYSVNMQMPAFTETLEFQIYKSIYNTKNRY